MVYEQLAFYPHRHNKDGSFDSICLSCFATIATANTEAELAEYDKSHVCTREMPRDCSAPRIMSPYTKLSFNTKSVYLAKGSAD